MKVRETRKKMYQQRDPLTCKNTLLILCLHLPVLLVSVNPSLKRSQPASYYQY